MKEAVKVKVNKDTLYFLPFKYKLKENVTVIVETENGLEFGKVIEPSVKVDNNEELNRIIRISTKRDYQNYKQNILDAKEALKKAKDIVQDLNLNMYVLDAYYNFERSKLFFRFLADARIDFRDLAKELASIYKTRIELRQIGIRDKAKETGGVGMCGRCLCCSKFLKDFDSVSISMVKNQNISLNPNKINGVCGRLLCCLKYEDENYKECRKCLPKVGSTVETKEGKGIVKDVDILNKKYRIETKDHGILEVEV